MPHTQEMLIGGASPSVLLVHGPFTDSSVWSGVVAALHGGGVDVTAVATPLRDLAGDTAYVAAIARAVDGPVLLVGHCYGGAVAGAASAVAHNVVGVVYVAAFVLDPAESCEEIAARFPVTLLGTALRPAVTATSVELYLRRESYREVFAADRSPAEAAVAAASQRPITAAAFEQAAPDTPRRALPTWYALATADRMLHPEAQRFMAARAGAHTVEIDASHSCPASRPDEVAALVRAALERTTPGRMPRGPEQEQRNGR
jgi:pimeloyl-ACP methyl ester carboxylesterase